MSSPTPKIFLIFSQNVLFFSRLFQKLPYSIIFPLHCQQHFQKSPQPHRNASLYKYVDFRTDVPELKKPRVPPQRITAPHGSASRRSGVDVCKQKPHRRRPDGSDAPGRRAYTSGTDKSSAPKRCAQRPSTSETVRASVPQRSPYPPVRAPSLPFFLSQAPRESFCAFSSI